MKLHIEATGFELGRELERYVDGKISILQRRLPRTLRADSSCTIRFAQSGQGPAKHSTCTIVLNVKEASFRAQESTQHMYAALDIATVHVEQQLLSYLESHGFRPKKGQWYIP